MQPMRFTMDETPKEEEFEDEEKDIFSPSFDFQLPLPPPFAAINLAADSRSLMMLIADLRKGAHSLEKIRTERTPREPGGPRAEFFVLSFYRTIIERHAIY